MGERLDPCNAARLIVSVAGPTRGGSLGFTPFHVVEALKYIRLRPLGRPALQRVLGIGESSIKTLVSRLSSSGLAERSSRGIAISRLGAMVLEALGGVLNYVVIKGDLPGLWDEDSILINIPCAPPPKSLTEVYRVRDYLVEEGCKMAVIGGFEGGSFKAPGTPDYLVEPISPVVEDAASQGLVILAPLKCMPGAVSAALKLLAEECPCRL